MKNVRFTAFGVLLLVTGGGLPWTVHVLLAAPEATGAAETVLEQDASTRDADDPQRAAHFRGRVIDRKGKPVRGARVFVTHARDFKGALVLRAATGSDGSFEFDAPDMTYLDNDGLAARRSGVLSVSAEGYGPAWVQVEGRGEALFSKSFQTDFALTLDAGDVPIRGWLLDPQGGPLVDARVRLLRLEVPPARDLDAMLERYERSGLGGCHNFESDTHNPETIGLATETRTDAEGRFMMSGLGRERLATFEVTAPGIIRTYLTVMTRNAPDVRVNLKNPAIGLPPQFVYGAVFTRTTQPGDTITGIVRDRHTQQPLADMWVGLADNARNGLNPDHAVSDAQGRFQIIGLDPTVPQWKVTAVSSPGQVYQAATLNTAAKLPVVVQCQRGIPFRLKLVDEQGAPVDAKVLYVDVMKGTSGYVGTYPNRWPVTWAARKANGSYEGFVVPGPGAVMVEMPERGNYRAASVDPKVFFAPEQIVWSQVDRDFAYGNTDTVATTMGPLEQARYAAIVLVNPAADSAPLELSATVTKKNSRLVSLVDADGKPVVGAHTAGITLYPFDQELPLRSASFPLDGLHPQRPKRITFFEPERGLIGYLAARSDRDEPYTVRMQPWGTVTGRLVDADSEPVPASFTIERLNSEGKAETELGHHVSAAKAEEDGRFRIEMLIPHTRYNARTYPQFRKFGGMAFENLAVEPGEVRHLGDICIQRSGAAKR